MSMQYTDSQKEAIFKNDANILVSAAAGSGKTRVLVDRVIRMIVEDGIDIQKMLIVTFTNAAAGEMKTRIEEGLEKALDQYPEKHQLISAAIEKLPMAKISTMHAFCIDTIRKYFHLLQISSNFKIISETNAAVLKDKAMQQTLESFYESKDPAFYDFVRAYGGHLNDEGVKSMIRKLASFLRGHPNPPKWREKTIAALKANVIEEDLFIDNYIRYAITILQHVNQALDHLEMLVANTELEPLMETIAADRALYEAYVAHFKHYTMADDIRPPAPNFARQKSIRLKDAPEEINEIRESFKDIRKSCVREPIEDIFNIMPEGSYHQVIADRALVLPYIEMLFSLTDHYLNAFTSLKQEENYLDFNDVEHAMLSLLENKEVCREVSQKTEYIFFDEYQDANPIQETIINALSHEHKLFFVGDIKQAIYRFRLADPTLFHNRHQLYSLEEEKGQVIHLDQNFRSDRRILTFANKLFENLMSLELGEVNYRDKGHALISGQNKVCENGTPVELILLEDNESSTKTALEEEQLFDREAYWIGQKIKEMVRQGYYQYKDIVVLMRSPRSELAEYEQVFKKMKIPFFTDNTTVTFRNLEVSLFLSLLHTINNDKDDINLLAVLLSPFGGFSEDDIARIRLNQQEGSFFQALKSYSLLEDALAEKIKSFYQQLEEWRRLLQLMRLGDFVRYLFMETGYETFLLGLMNGQEKHENLQALIELIEQYDTAANDGLVGFLNYANILIEDERDTLNPAVSFASEHDVVRIMSIHKSKGLEFPVVFLANTKKQFNLMDIRDKLNLDKDLGIGLEAVHLAEKYRYAPFELQLIRWKKEIELKSEEIRLLYVAVTRAVERLYIVAWDKNMAKLLQKCNYQDLYGEKVKALNLLSWILPIAQKLLNQPLSELAPDAAAAIDDYLVVRRLYIEQDVSEAVQKKETEWSPDLEKINFLRERFLYQYPYEEDIFKPYKRTISELAQSNVVDDPIISIQSPTVVKNDFYGSTFNLPQPAFMKEQKPLSAAEIGTIMHKAIEKLELRRWTEEELKERFNLWLANGQLTEMEYNALNIKQLYDFFQSPLADRIYEADEVERERAFTMAEDGYLLDGQIDLFFKENDSYVVVDFKTDRSIDEDKYRLQLSYYAKAIEKAFDKPVKECWIYWLHFGQMSRLS